MEGKRPVPLPDAVTAPFWEACRRHELVVQYCEACDVPRFPPQPMCARCRSFACRWRPASGRGEVFSFVVCHPPVLPAFRDRAPYLVVLVQLAESDRLRMIGNLLGCTPQETRIGMPVEVCFEEVEDGLILPQWRPLMADSRPPAR